MTIKPHRQVLSGVFVLAMAAPAAHAADIVVIPSTYGAAGNTGSTGMFGGVGGAGSNVYDIPAAGSYSVGDGVTVRGGAGGKGGDGNSAIGAGGNGGNGGIGLANSVGVGDLAIGGTVAGGGGGGGGSITVSGSLNATGSGGDGGGGIVNTGSGAIDTLTISGTVSGGSGGAGASGLVQQAVGSYSYFRAGHGGSGAAGISNAGTMTTIIISSGAGVIGGNGGDGGRNGISGSATNYGGNGGSGIANSGAIGALVISGSVTGGSGGNVGRNGSGTDGTDGAGLANSGTIDALSIIGGTVTGGGTAYGISNSGTIRSLTNSQSGLTYSGILPTTYQTYFTSAGSYGSVVFSATSGSLAYGLAKASGTTYAVGTYANVIESNVALTFSLLALNRVTYALSQVSRCSTATYCYDLTISSVTPWSAVGEGAGGQAGRLGAALDRIAEAGGLSAPLARLDALSPAGQAHALKQMAASGLVPSLLSGGTTLIPSNSAIGGRLDMAMAAGGATGASAGDAVQRGVLWGQVLGNHASLDNSSAGDGFSSDAFGLLVGADTDIADNAVAGVAVNWLRAVAQGKSDSSGNSIIVDVYQLSLYGAWRPEGRAVWTQGVASVGLNRYDQKRAIDYLGETAAARFQGRQMQAKVSGGYDFPLDDGLTVTPQASLQVSRLQNQGYTETGSAMGQAVRSQGFNSVESVIGGKLAYTLDTDRGGLNADVQAGWRHDYVASPIVTAADLGGVGYTIATARLPSNGAQIGLGAGLRQGDELSFRLEYDGDLRDGYASHTGLLRVRQSL